MHHLQEPRWGNPPCLSACGCPLLGRKKLSDLMGALWGHMLAGNETRLLGPLANDRFWAKFWPGAFWSQSLALCRLLGRQWSAPSGAIRKRPFVRQILAREPFGDRFWQFGGFPAGKRLLELLGNGPFGLNPGREPFGARFWHFAGFWKPLGSFWEASKTSGNGRAPVSSAQRPENTKAQAFLGERFSQSDAASRTPFLVTLKLYFAFLKLGTSFWQPETIKGYIVKLVLRQHPHMGKGSRFGVIYYWLRQRVWTAAPLVKVPLQ